MTRCCLAVENNGYDSFDYDCYESEQWLNYQLDVNIDEREERVRHVVSL